MAGKNGIVLPTLTSTSFDSVAIFFEVQLDSKAQGWIAVISWGLSQRLIKLV